MKNLRVLICCIISILILFFAQTALAIEMDVPASAAILVEQKSGRVLFSKDAHVPRPMASTTKIMTALIVLEECDLSDIVEIDRRMSGIEGSSMYLEVGERLTVEELLYGLMLRSGNDAAVALAIHAGESLEGFVEMMNERALAMGLENTSFTNPHGLHHENHHTTAYELAIIAREAMEHEVFKEIITTDKKVVSWEGHEWNRVLSNKNQILSLIEGGNGIKTGYTKAAGRCLVSSAVQEGMQLIAVTLNCQDDFNISAKLLQRGFDEFSMVLLAEKGAILGQVKTDLGMANVIAGEDIALPMKGAEQLSYSIEIPASISGSYEKGAVVGWLDIFSNEERTSSERIANEGIASEKIASFELEIERSIDSDSFWGKIKMIMNNW
ncbi:MAG: serine hydrolase [Christensenellales bacterium]|jgi:D-alanyl-D-alanine carboxypeptidase (penicillin-binding protein 5/6)